MWVGVLGGVWVGVCWEGGMWVDGCVLGGVCVDGCAGRVGCGWLCWEGGVCGCGRREGCGCAGRVHHTATVFALYRDTHSCHALCGQVIRIRRSTHANEELGLRSSHC